MHRSRKRHLRNLGIGRELIAEWSRRGINPTETVLRQLREAVVACAKEGISREVVEQGEIAALRGNPPSNSVTVAVDTIQKDVGHHRQLSYDNLYGARQSSSLSTWFWVIGIAAFVLLLIFKEFFFNN